MQRADMRQEHKGLKGGRLLETGIAATDLTTSAST